MSVFTYLVNGVDRSDQVALADDVQFEDCRGAGIPSFVLTIRPGALTPVCGMEVRVQETVGGTTRTLFTGQITRRMKAQHGVTWCYDCTVTAIKFLLTKTERIYKRYAATGYQEAVLADAPVGYWRLGEAAGTTLVDASGYGRHGSYVGGEAVTYGAAGAVHGDTAVTFNGVAGYATGPEAFPYPFRITGDLTLEFWVKEAARPARVTVLSKGFNYEFEVTLEVNGSITFYHGNGVGNFPHTIAAVGALPADGTWRHVAIVRDTVAGTIVCYINGVAQGAPVVCAHAIVAGTLATTIAREASAAAQFLAGSLDEVAIYNAALSQARILAHIAAIGEPLVSANTIASDLITFAPAGWTLAAEAGLPSFAEMVFNGVTVWEAYEQLAARIGAMLYADENYCVHLYVTTDAGVEQPDPLTSANTRFGPTLTDDYSQAVTRQHVEGQGTTLAIPASVGDTEVYPADASIFPDSGRLVARAVPEVRCTYTGRHLWRKQASPGSITAGLPTLTINSAADFPAQGWAKLAAGVYIRYHTLTQNLAGTPILLLEGAYHIQSITRAGAVATLTTVEAAPLWRNPGGSVHVDGVGTGAWGNRDFTITAWPAPNQIRFNCTGTEPNLGAVGYCYSFGGLLTALLTRSGREVTANCSAAHGLSVGRWVNITGSAEDYNGHQVVTRVSGAFGFCFETDATPEGSFAGATVCPLGWLPSVPGGSSTIEVCPVLTGAVVTAPIAAGTPVSVLAVEDDLVAQAALAALDGSDGVRVGPPISDAGLTGLAARTRAEAELTVRSTGERHMRYGSLDEKTRAGSTVTVDGVSMFGELVPGSHKIVRVRFSQLNQGPLASVVRDVETSDKRFTPADIFQQLQNG
ncbi:MAG: LamG domain-containing protein [Acidobacteria bacterium]|nr:LamG domain-containing protein [Acidobacteriota bacterium]